MGENHNIMNLTKLTKSQIQKLIEDDPSGGVIQKIIELFKKGQPIKRMYCKGRQKSRI